MQREWVKFVDIRTQGFQVAAEQECVALRRCPWDIVKGLRLRKGRIILRVVEIISDEIHL